MADEMSSIPPRVGDLEKEVHTLKHRLGDMESVHRDIPHRMTKVEIAVERLPQIEKQLQEQGDMIKRGFVLTHGILLGAGGLWVVFKIGPEILRFLGAR
jgi:hypothetical protein